MLPAKKKTYRLPGFVKTAMTPLPLAPVQIACRMALKRILRRHPDIFVRLGEYAGDTFLIELVDLPFNVLIDTSPQKPDVIVLRSLSPQGEKAAAKISGSVLSHLKMVSGRLDGDALFFSRELAISGNTGAVLALRNTIDSMDMNIRSLLS